MANTAQKMSTFTYEGTDRKGNKTKGEIAGTNPTLVKAELRKQGINPKKVTKKRGGGSFGKKKIETQDIAIFSRQMATMMKAGVPLVQSFDIVADGLENPSMKEMVLAIKNDVSGGSNFASALSKHPRQFDDLFCNLVDAGEQSGALETMLDRVATYKEKTEAMKKKVKKAMTYPVSVMVVAVIVTAILLLKVVPQFEAVFSNFGADLPAFTQFLVNLSRALSETWYLFLGGIMAAIFAFREAHVRSEKFRNGLDEALLKAPVVGNIVKKSAISRFARTLSTTFAAGVPLVDALDSVAGATGNIVFARATKTIKDDVSTGSQLNFAIRSTGVFPNMLVQMVAIGEESGALDTMLDKVASFYEAEVDDAVDNMSTLMEPIIMSVLGVLVGGLIIGMYLPIFQLGKVVS